MFAPTSSKPPSGITRSTLRDNVAFELPVGAVMEDGTAVGRVAVAERCGAALVGATRLGAGRAFGVPVGLLIIIYFRSFSVKFGAVYGPAIPETVIKRAGLK